MGPSIAPRPRRNCHFWGGGLFHYPPPLKVPGIERRAFESPSWLQKLDFGGRGRRVGCSARAGDPSPGRTEASRAPRGAPPRPFPAWGAPRLGRPRAHLNRTPSRPRPSPRAARRPEGSAHDFKARSGTVLGRPGPRFYTRGGGRSGVTGRTANPVRGPPATRPRPSAGPGRWRHKSGEGRARGTARATDVPRVGRPLTTSAPVRDAPSPSGDPMSLVLGGK